MKVFKHTNQSKKLILVIVCIMLFSFCCPKQVHAMIGMDDIVAAPCIILFSVERGIIRFLNNIFCDDNHKYEYSGSTTEIYLTPENIIKGKFALLDANIFNKVNTVQSSGDPAKAEYYDVSGGTLTDGLVSGKNSLRDTIAGWYYALRNLAIVALLSVLVYVGIRMLMTSVSQDKAKYKMMLKDWFVALILLFAMHYIMVGILSLSSDITKAIGSSGQNANLASDSFTILTYVTAENKVEEGNNTIHKTLVKDVPFNDYSWVDTDGKVEKDAEYTLWDGYAHMIMLGAIIGYTIIFAIKYLKRMITIIFLILIAPISCVTYPIDKIGDGKAQAYNMWFQEFLYEVIIQPFHLLIYVVLVGSATTLASKNLLYGIMCFAVMIPAEKFIKQMFGFKDKLGSPLGAFAGGAAASQLLSKAFSGGDKAKKGDKVEGKSEADEGIRENKLKPGMPGADQGSGEPTAYEGTDEENNLPSPQNSEEEENDEQGAGAPSGSEPMVDDDGMGNADEEAYNQAAQRRAEGESQTEESNESDENSAGSDQEEEEELNGKGIYKNNPSKIGNAVNAMREHRDKKLMAKYGTKNRGEAFGKYARRKIASGAKRTVKGATTLAGAGALGLFGTMFGQGKTGLAAGATFGAKTGTGINNAASKSWSTTKEYGKEALYATKTEEQRRKERIEKAMKDSKQLEKASRSFSKRNNGKIANTEELNKELADRAKFKETGLNDDQIDDAMQIYDGNIKELGEDGAFQMAYTSANLASRYSAKDFEDPKKTQQMYDSLMRQYASMGVNQDLADENARAIISNAASTFGIKSPALSAPSRKDAYKADAENIAKAKASYAHRNGGKGPNKKQLDQELEMGFNLRKAGLSEDDSEQFFYEYLSNMEAINEAKASVGPEATDEEINNELERRFEIKVKAKIDSEKELSSHINAAKELIKENEQIQKPSNSKVYSEVKQRVTVKDSYHISQNSIDEMNSKISEVRKSEAKFVKDSVDKDGAKMVIDLQRSEVAKEAKDAIKNGKTFEDKDSQKFITKADYQRKFLTKYTASEMADDKKMEKAKETIMKDLKKHNNGYTKEFREKFADEIISKGRDICGIKEK